MGKRILAIILIFIASTFAWAILGGTIFARTGQTDSRLRGAVASIWGSEHSQRAPTATTSRTVLRRVTTNPDQDVVAAPGQRRTATTMQTRTVEEQVTDDLALDRTRADVALALEHRQKGLLWYSTYTVRFAGQYTFRNTTGRDSVTFTLQYPTQQAVYDDLAMTLNGRPLQTVVGAESFTATATVAPGDTALLGVSYRSQGLEKWGYLFGSSVSSVKDFALTVHTDFEDIDFAQNSLAPSTKTRTATGWDLEWRYNNLVSGYDISVLMPEKLQPGPLAGRISFFAPVSLLFFFLLMFILTTIRGVELHPMNYFFLAAAFFAFHLLLAYLVDHVDIHLSFVIASLVSVGLVASYLRLVTGPGFALRYAAPAQIIFLVLFSYAFFFEGYAGLTITIGSVLTLFAVMQLTGRVRWAELFATRTGELRDGRPRVPVTP